MAAGIPLQSSKNLTDIDPRRGISEDDRTRVYPLEPGSKVAVERLVAFLGDAAREVMPRFEATKDGKARLVELWTGPQANAVEALQKLGGLLEGTGLEKTDASHNFNARQTAAILENLPRIARTHA